MRVIAGLACVLALATAPEATPSQPLVREAYLMGTHVSLATWADDRASGLATLNTALGVLENAEAELSTWHADSAVSKLNRHAVGRPFALRPPLCAMLRVLFEWHAATAGTFDPAIGRLTDAWGIHAEGRVPPPAILREARAASGLSLFAFDLSRCEMTRRGDATIDVGAFGKGEALDRVERALGRVAWMINLGGQVSVHGAPPGEQGWRVAIAHPRNRQDAALDVVFSEGSLSTSAGSERDLFVDGRRVSHHLDPRTGEPATYDGSVTVWHRRGLVADILSTALFVMGPDEGLEWAQRRGIAACFLQPRANGSLKRMMTPSFERLIVKP